MDNFSGHIVRTDDLDKLTVVFLPPKSTSKHQSLGKGIIAALKKKYVGKLSHEKLIILKMEGIFIKELMCLRLLVLYLMHGGN